MATSKTTKGKKVTCELCGKQFVQGYINTHKRNQHGIYQRGPKARNGSGSKPTFNDLTVVEDMVLLTDDEGGLWVAEKLR